MGWILEYQNLESADGYNDGDDYAVGHGACASFRNGPERVTIAAWPQYFPDGESNQPEGDGARWGTDCVSVFETVDDDDESTGDTKYSCDDYVSAMFADDLDHAERMCRAYINDPGWTDGRYLTEYWPRGSHSRGYRSRELVGREWSDGLSRHIAGVERGEG